MNGATTLRRLAPLVAGAVSTGFLQVLADALHRSTWAGVSRGRHVAAALLMHGSVGALVAVLGALAYALYARLERAASRRFPAARRVLLPIVVFVLASAGVSGTARWIFSGERVRGSVVGTIGPAVVVLVVGVVAAVFAVLVRSTGRSVERFTLPKALGVALALLLISTLLVRVDFTLYVSLYARLHAALELTAALCAFSAMTLFFSVLSRRSAGASRGLTWFAGASVLAMAFFVFSPRLRAWVDDALRHAWREPVYVGRMLSRIQVVEGFIRDPKGWRGATMSSVVVLRERYDIATTERSPRWDTPLEEPAWLVKRLDELRGPRAPNVVVFYVDTLRADIAADPRVMPNAVQLASGSVNFRRAYTTGSDTLHALPGIVGGSYDLFAKQPNGLLHVARGAGYRSALAVAQSAREFLGKLLPEFVFDETLDIPDYAPGNENVWGYGADQPTATRLVDRSLDWIRDRRDSRFFLWMFNFDLHNWRELDEAYVRQAGKQSGLLDESDPVWRYRVVAHAVDAQLGRLLEGLRDLDVDRNTVVLFISDHGEGLGVQGFWVHSVYLWESLVHVPLILRVPGCPAATVNDLVSLVDVAPTLGRLMDRGSDTAGYQGEDLLSNLVAGHPKRRLPLLLMGTLKEVPVRLGIIDPESPFKLVLPLEGAVPELYDLRLPDPDSRDVTPEHPSEMLRLLNDLVRSPMFPRLSEAGTDGALDQAAADGRTAIQHEAAARAAADEQAAAAAGASSLTDEPPDAGGPARSGGEGDAR